MAERLLPSQPAMAMHFAAARADVLGQVRVVTGGFAGLPCAADHTRKYVRCSVPEEAGRWLASAIQRRRRGAAAGVRRDRELYRTLA